ncbi:phosphate uptake regulator PhoU [Salinarchaeum sp. IM2453]|uniref:phosphate signaling complex PhoU family protein n=1 Tax=Salinarchaeum sp. IM2453 TaxID=2862870 RepID=UPI001C82AB2A|nr:phosphate uptake regulator PhoU [Salinarchaeum sp. IM2453]QZA88651.1 phosphate uptake regulator PhoU [Salinarchaeum sp. IM2453]
METRKVQLTGGSTYTVSLPKDWAMEQGVESGSEVEFHQEGQSLLLSLRDEREPAEGTLDVSGLEGDRLISAVMTMYVSGFDTIILEDSNFTPDRRQTVREAVQSLVGVEVLEETETRVVIRDLLDSAELSIHDAVTRMHLIALGMLEDSITALVENNDKLAQDVRGRDDDVDRLWFVVSRTFRATLRSPQESQDLGLPREECFAYHSSARQLERIADHATKISKLALDLEEISDEVTDALKDLLSDAQAIVNTAMDALFEEDSDASTELAHQARESIVELDKHTRHIDQLLRTLDPREAQSVGLIVDSLSRSADYGGNIAETALQKAAPKPQ